MQKNSATNIIDPRVKIFGIIAAILVVGGLIYAFSGDSNNGNSQGEKPKLVLNETSYNFGDISMKNGLARRIFTIKNEGAADLEITNMNTSCMCTTVTLDIDGQKSPTFGMPGHGGGVGSAFWSQKIKPGQTGNLEVVFDPLAHGSEAVGPITREINIFSNDNGKSNSKSVIVFTGNVIK